MPQAIQRPPVGMLSLLGSKGTGFNPTELLDGVVPIIDLTAFYQAQDISSTLETGAATNVVGNGAFTTVPQGEYWQLLGVGGLWSGFTAGSVFRACIEIGFQPNLIPVATSGADHTISAGATDIFRIPWVPAQPTILSPGMRIATTLLQTMANQATPQIRVLYLSLR